MAEPERYKEFLPTQEKTPTVVQAYIFIRSDDGSARSYRRRGLKERVAEVAERELESGRFGEVVNFVQTDHALVHKGLVEIHGYTPVDGYKEAKFASFKVYPSETPNQ